MARTLFLSLFLATRLLADSTETIVAENIGGFVAGTIVHTFTGPDTIQNIRIGDRLLSFDLETGKVVESRVTDTHQEQVDELARLVIEGEEFYVNPDHRFYIADTHEWVAARSLQPGTDVLLSKTGKYLTIDQVVVIAGKSYIYDLTVEDTKNYFVGEHQVLAHNFAFVIPLFAWSIGEGLIILSGATISALAATAAIYAIKELSRSDPGDFTHLSRNFQPKDRVDGDRARMPYPVDVYIRSRNNQVPDSKAQGDHSTRRPGPTGDSDHYETWRDKGVGQHPKDPHRWESEKRFDGSGDGHYNKATGQRIDTPHVHAPKTPGGVRAARPDEVPK